MNKDVARKLIQEAKHSMAVLIGFVGKNTPVNSILLKWPDVIDDVLNGDEEAFNKDVALIVCEPLRILAESFSEYNKSPVDIADIMKNCINDPIGVKTSLIGVCNIQINKLRSSGMKIDFIKEFGK